jgi:hypothetical protein
MLVDLYRLIRIALKFLFYDLWIGVYMILFGKQNPGIKEAYHKRIGNKKRRV